MRKLASNAFKTFMGNRTVENRNNYTSARNRYKNRCKKSRNTHWNKFVREMKDISEQAKLVKILNKAPAPTTSTFKKEDGLYTLPGNESLEYLLGAHFPDMDKNPVIRYDLNKKNSINSLDNLYCDWI